MKIFISYPDKDKRLAQKLKSLCARWGHECFVAADSGEKLIHPKGWLVALMHQIERADIFLLCLNRGSLQAGVQQIEWKHVLPKGTPEKRIVYEGEWNSHYENVFPFVRTHQCFRYDAKKDLDSFKLSLPSDPPEQERFRFLEKLVIGAGTQLILRQKGTAIFGPPTPIDIRKNYALDVDVEIQNQIVAQIRERFKGDGIIAEENPERNFSPHNTTGYIWVIDPLDGTLNFQAGDDKFCCGVGILRDGRPFMGAIFVPSKMELYTGGVGREAKCHSLSTGMITVIHSDSSVRTLGQCCALSHINADKKRLEVCFEDDLPRKLHQSVRRVWMWGCGLLATLSVAQGQHHIFLQRVTYPYDIIPALPILESAGACWNIIPNGTPLNWNPDKTNVGVIVTCSEGIMKAFQRRFPNLAR